MLNREGNQVRIAGVSVGLGLVVLVILCGVLSIFGLVLYGVVNGIKRTASNYESSLTAQYANNQENLSNYIRAYKENLGIADRAIEQVDDAISNAIEARNQETADAAFVAIIEAYPDLRNNADLYARAMDATNAARKEWSNDQMKMRDMIRSYRNWRNQDLIRDMYMGVAGYPSEDLYVDTGSRVIYGEEAERLMLRAIQTSLGAEATDSGILEPLEAPSE